MTVWLSNQMIMGEEAWDVTLGGVMPPEPYTSSFEISPRNLYFMRDTKYYGTTNSRERKTINKDVARADEVLRVLLTVFFLIRPTNPLIR